MAWHAVFLKSTKIVIFYKTWILCLEKFIVSLFCFFLNIFGWCFMSIFPRLIFMSKYFAVFVNYSKTFFFFLSNLLSVIWIHENILCIYNYLLCNLWNVDIIWQICYNIGYEYLTHLSTMFQLYRRCMFCYWRNPVHQEKTTDLSQA